MELKVMTFNLRLATKGDGDNIFWNRTPRILEMLKTEAPDIIGFQEATTAMRLWLSENLAPLGYTVVGCGRDANCHGEGTAVAFRRDKFELLSLDHFWLSATPHIPGSTFGGDQSPYPRISTAVVLKADDCAPFLFLNTHLDHIGVQARRFGAMQVMQYIADKGMHFVLTGDMNAHPDTAEIADFTATPVCGTPVVEATVTVKGTFHGYGKYPPDGMRKIDYIFTDMPTDPAHSYAVEDEPVEGIYLSDHRPVVSFVEIG